MRQQSLSGLSLPDSSEVPLRRLVRDQQEDEREA